MTFTVVITLCSALILNIPIQQYIMLLECVISCISSYIYYHLFHITKENEIKKEAIDWKHITLLRYNGWVFTTPIMLLSLILFLSISTKINISIPLVCTVVFLDWSMLLLGYLGETNYIDRTTALLTGFIPFFIIFGIIYRTFLKNYIFFNHFIFALFVLFWGLYGLGYILPLEPRNSLMDILDLLAKSGIGLIFAFYFLFIK